MFWVDPQNPGVSSRLSPKGMGVHGARFLRQALKWNLRGISKTPFHKNAVSLPISVETLTNFTHFESARRALSNGAIFIEARDDWECDFATLEIATSKNTP